MKKPLPAKISAVVSIVLFLWLIYYEIVQNVPEYIADSLLFIGMVLTLLFLYNKLDLDLLSFNAFLVSLLLHNAGAFGWYNTSPVGFQWDHITHIMGGFAITLILFRFCRRFCRGEKFAKRYLMLVIILASLGAGAIIEFYEFAGYFIVGEGAGGLGHGVGDIVTELGNSEWFNTMFDMLYNLVGAIIAMIVGVIKKYNKK